ncbi:MAG: lytic transglycosylase domain-containing protein [Hyphomicrobiales bacterium]
MIGRRAFLGTVLGACAAWPFRSLPAFADIPDNIRPLAELSKALSAAIAAYRNEDLASGDAAALALNDPLARLVAEWVALRTNPEKAGFDRIAAFLSLYRDWPTVAFIRRKGEEALYRDKHATPEILSFFGAHQPLTPTGRYLKAMALQDEGRVKEASDTIRKAWREDSFSSELETNILERFDEALTSGDHRERVEMMIAQENWAAALRAAEKAQASVLALAKIRIAVGKRDADAEKLLKSASASLKADPGYILSEAQFLRRADRLEEAYEALSRFPKDQTPPRPDEWWTERRVLARRLVETRKLDLILDLLKPRPGMNAAALADASFMAGVFTLDLSGDAARAETFFRESEQKATVEAGRIRAAYWIAQARKAQNLDPNDALNRAARMPLYYYGMLAREALGQHDLSFRSTPQPDFDRAAEDQLFQAIILLLDAGGGEFVTPLAGNFIQRVPDAPTLSALASLGASYRDLRLVTIAGKAAQQKNYGFDFENWPIDDFPLPENPPLERALIYAITRQESSFDPNAISSAGARGLMHLMVATAQETAKKANINFAAEKLTADPAYNVKIGSTHLAELIEDWGGSYCLAIASYNAGKGNVRKWIAANGDPREKGIDPVRWVERIPVTETRIYVQRVMENLQIYRARLEGRSTTTLMDDLRRGASL